TENPEPLWPTGIVPRRQTGGRSIPVFPYIYTLGFSTVPGLHRNPQISLQSCKTLLEREQPFPPIQTSDLRVFKIRRRRIRLAARIPTRISTETRTMVPPDDQSR